MLKSVQEASVQRVPAGTFSQIIKNRWGGGDIRYQRRWQNKIYRNVHMEIFLLEAKLSPCLLRWLNLPHTQVF
jgi:hypothetical protein